MSISTGVVDPRNCCAVCSTGTRGGVNANHWSVDRFGSSATMRATLASGGAPASGKRRLRQARCGTSGSIGSAVPSARKLPSGLLTPHCSFSDWP